MKDWRLIGAEETGGYTTIEVKRALDTKDLQDRGNDQQKKKKKKVIS
jgi:hypothetical protein